jgi:glyoxylase-like metal-dependent hydrolase (beta-lactamase superfamily II)
VTFIREPVPGIRLIRLPLPFELEHVNVGLVQLADGFMLIDTGMTFDALSTALDELGVRWPEIKTVLATHIHPDHIACAPGIIAVSGAKLSMHRAEFAYLNRILSAQATWMDAAFAQSGLPASEWEIIRKSVGGMRKSLSAIHPDTLLEGGESIPTALGPATVVATPGHSLGHICLYWPDQRLLYSGDHMIETITPNIAWMPERDMLGEYLESLDRVGELDVELVMASHGEPFRHHRDWIRATKLHHQERCDQVLRHLTSGPQTAYELVPVLWDRNFSSFHLYFALFEVLAHLEYMRRQGRVMPDASNRWSRTQSVQVHGGL